MNYVGSAGLVPEYPGSVASKEPSQIDGVMFAAIIVAHFGVQRKDCPLDPLQ
jgi:hypothetical protein